MNKWRIVKSAWNMEQRPWTGAVGIEEDDKDAGVTALVCWFYRGVDRSVIDDVIRIHNEG